MSDSPLKDPVKRLRQAVFTLLLVAVGVRIAWSFIAPLVPILISLAVLLTVLWVAFGGRLK